LRERAALAQDELNVGLGHDGSSPELSVLAKEADLIVHGRIVTSRSYLSDDGMLVYSEYPVQVRRVIAGSFPAVSRTPAQGQLNVTHEGGELQLEGKRVRVSNMLLPRLPVGSDVILFLRRSPDGKYAVVRQGYGAFAIDGDTVSALSRRGGPHQEFDGKPVAAFDRAIQSWRAR
jgi:hypothetical protein